MVLQQRIAKISSHQKFWPSRTVKICSCKPQKIANLQNKTSAKVSCYMVFCSGLHFWRHRFNKFSLSLVNSSWLWWIVRVALTSQKQWNIFWINNIKYYNNSYFVRWSLAFVHLYYLFQFLFFDWTCYEKEPLQICVSILLIFQMMIDLISLLMSIFRLGQFLHADEPVKGEFANIPNHKKPTVSS